MTTLPKELSKQRLSQLRGELVQNAHVKSKHTLSIHKRIEKIAQLQGHLLFLANQDADSSAHADLKQFIERQQGSTAHLEQHSQTRQELAQAKDELMGEIREVKSLVINSARGSGDQPSTMADESEPEKASEAKPAEEAVNAVLEEAMTAEDDGDIVMEEAKPAEEAFNGVLEEAKPAEEAANVALEEAKLAEEAVNVGLEEAKAAEEAFNTGLEEAKPAEEAANVVPEEAKAAEEAVNVTLEEAKPAEEAQTDDEKDDNESGSNSSGIGEEGDDETISSSEMEEDLSLAKPAEEAFNTGLEEAKPAKEAANVVPEEAKPAEEAVNVVLEEATPAEEAVNVALEEAKPAEEAVMEMPWEDLPATCKDTLREAGAAMCDYARVHVVDVFNEPPGPLGNRFHKETEVIEGMLDAFENVLERDAKKRRTIGYDLLEELDRALTLETCPERLAALNLRKRIIIIHDGFRQFTASTTLCETDLPSIYLYIKDTTAIMHEVSQGDPSYWVVKETVLACTRALIDMTTCVSRIQV